MDEQIHRVMSYKTPNITGLGDCRAEGNLLGQT